MDQGTPLQFEKNIDLDTSIQSELKSLDLDSIYYLYHFRYFKFSPDNSRFDKSDSRETRSTDYFGLSLSTSFFRQGPFETIEGNLDALPLTKGTIAFSISYLRVYSNWNFSSSIGYNQYSTLSAYENLSGKYFVLDGSNISNTGVLSNVDLNILFSKSVLELNKVKLNLCFGSSAYFNVKHNLNYTFRIQTISGINQNVFVLQNSKFLNSVDFSFDVGISISKNVFKKYPFEIFTKYSFGLSNSDIRTSYFITQGGNLLSTGNSESRINHLNVGLKFFFAVPRSN